MRYDSVLNVVRFTLNRFRNAIMSIELGIWESQLLNIASQSKAIKEFKLLRFLIARHCSHGKTHTSRTTLPIAFKLGSPLDSHRRNDPSIKINACLIVSEGITSYKRSVIKGREIVPKWTKRTFSMNMGLPKGSNSYGNGSIIVTALTTRLKYALGNAKGRSRIEASLLFKRTYVSGGDTEFKVNVGSKLNKLSLRSLNAPHEKIDRPIYSLLHSPEMLRYAYENIKSKPGNMTSGILTETLDGISEEVLQTISSKLKDESFRFSTSKRIEIPKPNGGTKPLTIAPPRDKIVQEALRLILEAIYEPLFLDCSHGFRPNRGCHTALKKVSFDFQTSQWIIEGDISKCFDKINHQKLMEILNNKIEDKRFINIIWKALTAGYMEFRQHKNNIIGTPQGSIVSPILANIFLHQLDQFVMNLKKSFDLGDQAPRTKISRYYEYHISQAVKNKDKQKLRKLIAQRSTNPQTEFGGDSYKRISYVRYADDWMIGVRGSAKETIIILEKVKEFCKQIGLEVSDTKTKITNINEDKALFLGTHITRSHHRSYSRIGNMKRMRRNKLGIRLLAPISRIREKLTKSNFVKNAISHPRFLWLHNDHDQIILLYNSVLRGFLNYYSFSHNLGRVASFTEFILKQSCAKLLATKFNLRTTAQVYKKFGNKLTSPKGYEFYKPSYKTTLKFLTSASPVIGRMFQEKTNRPFSELTCSVCESNYRVEFHHVRAMKNLNTKISYIDKLMVKANRKRIPLCRTCHLERHRSSSKAIS
uniref:Reverse transcriptase domain-containing protein n=1 Tax=Arthrobotrys musiformis TaxID=47236 RepID=A0A482EAI7_9PEZI|nr:hypothetical protein [Arthrobotrys musiformis]QBM31499.1 hypothetical protein [Arthrobotrys musiformis]QBM31649.1 hypothetical protein [Arthrobotrys musiformis]